jgi:predicted NBD/HSP70 family sugar kinase
LFYDEQITLSIRGSDNVALRRIKKIMADNSAAAPASQIIRALSQHGGMSSAQIARHTGLARSTISTAVSELKANRVVVEIESEPRKASSAGRPGTTLTLNPSAGSCVGIHLGYEDVHVTVADLAHAVIAEREFVVGVDYKPEDVTDLLREAVHTIYREQQLSFASLVGVGVSVSGPVRDDGTLLRGGILPRWSGVNIHELFAKLFNKPVVVDNESNCAALAELKWGAAQGIANFVLFKLDVGVGGAIVSNGAIVKGIAGGAGEFGHVSINPDGDLCRCGNRGCVELYASFVKPLEQLSRVNKRPMTIADCIALAEAGDIGALRMIEDAGTSGGRALAMVGTILNPPLILIGGRLALADDLLLRPLRKAYDHHTLLRNAELTNESRTHIRVGKFPERDSMLGAVGLVLDQALFAVA